MFLAISHANGDYPMWNNALKTVGEQHPIPSFQRVVMLGNYFGEAQYAKKMAKTLLGLHMKYPHIVFLKGPVELALWGSAQDEEEVRSYYMKWLLDRGYEPLLDVFKEHIELFEALLPLLEQMPSFYAEGGYLFTHQGFDLDPWLKGFDEEMTLALLECIGPEDLLLYDSFYEQIQQDLGKSKETLKEKLKEFPFTLVAGGWDESVPLPHPVHGLANGRVGILSDARVKVI